MNWWIWILKLTLTQKRRGLRINVILVLGINPVVVSLRNSLKMLGIKRTVLRKVVLIRLVGWIGWNCSFNHIYILVCSQLRIYLSSNWFWKLNFLDSMKILIIMWAVLYCSVKLITWLCFLKMSVYLADILMWLLEGCNLNLLSSIKFKKAIYGSTESQRVDWIR